VSKPIKRYEYGRLLIGEEGFTKSHWEAFVKLNTVHDNKYFDILHNGLRFKHFVGVVQVDDCTVEINPKADKQDSDSRWEAVLLKMLKSCGHLKADTLGGAQVKKQHLNLLEVYFEYFLKEIEYLQHQGLVKKYRHHTGNVKALKGKLDFAGNIRNNLVHKERFYTQHQVYDHNHKLHQVLNHALDIVGAFTAGTRLYDRCKRVQLAFPEMKTIQVNEAVLSTIKLDRKTKGYEFALELSRLIILNYSPSINSGKERMIALLFDMNMLWEEYVLKQVQKAARNHDGDEVIEVLGQKRKYFWNFNYIKPDIVINIKKPNESETKTYIIDTKWKIPSSSASIQDLRQMYAYARFWKADKVMLLYPGEEQNRDFSQFLNEEHDGNHYCKMGFVSVLDAQGNLDDKIGERVLESLSCKAYCKN
jgi:5-methylcytosine-specific restriction enzyme subunit McrC